MGFLTVVVLRNDALHSFKEHPEEFGKAILDGVDKAWDEHAQVSVPFREYANYIDVEYPRHADNDTLFLLSGNCLHVIGGYQKDWKNLVERNLECAKKFFKCATWLLKMAKADMIPRKNEIT